MSNDIHKQIGDHMLGTMGVCTGSAHNAMGLADKAALDRGRPSPTTPSRRAVAAPVTAPVPTVIGGGSYGSTRRHPLEALLVGAFVWLIRAAVIVGTAYFVTTQSERETVWLLAGALLLGGWLLSKPLGQGLFDTLARLLELAWRLVKFVAAVVLGLSFVAAVIIFIESSTGAG